MVLDCQNVSFSELTIDGDKTSDAAPALPELGIRLSGSLLWHLITVLVSDNWKKKKSCSSVCALCMEEGKGN